MPARLLLATTAVALLATCAPRAVEPLSAADEPEAERVTPPGGPVEATLDTRRAHVVRLVAPEPAAPPEGFQAPPAVLQVSAAVAGVSVSIDGEPGRPPPFELEVSPGVHEVSASCPDGTTDARQTVVAAGATVHVVLCSSGP